MAVRNILSALLLALDALHAARERRLSAVQPDEVLPDPALEARARAISEGLRCLVCQNQSIDDSDAPLAKDLRLLVRERLKQGDSDQQVVDFIVARYGEFVLLKPQILAAHFAALVGDAGGVRGGAAADLARLSAAPVSRPGRAEAQR